MKQNYEKGVLIVLCANLINMFISLITNFILPRYLNIENYAIIKTFQLYVSYIGLFHMGYSDGVYLKYGGKFINEIDKEKIQLSISTMVYFQSLIAFIVMIWSIFNHNRLVMIFSIDIIGFNLIGLFKNIYQALGEFKRYANITQLIAIINLGINVFLIFIKHFNNAYFFIAGYTLVDMFVFIYLVYDFDKISGLKKIQLKFSFLELITNVKDGILLLLGNLTSIILMSMDRWFTKIYMLAIDFAQYSFAVSVENLLNVAITPVSITLYNYLCNNQEKNKIRKIQASVLVFTSIIVFAVFPIKFIVERYLNNYIDSLKVIVILFSTQFFSVLIQSIYVNLYKAQKKQKRYFIEVLLVIIIGFILNVVFYNIHKVKESFAVGTLLSNFIWFIICQMDYKELRLSIKQLLYLIIELSSFGIFSLGMSTFNGAVCYILLTMILCLTLLKNEIKWIIKKIIVYLRKNKM